MSPRIEAKKPVVLVPGPGAYSPKSETILDKTPACGIGYGDRADLAETKKKIAPGPGAYSPPTVKKEGPKYGFGTSKREGIVGEKAKNVPGPGNYNIGSSVAELPSYEKSKMKI